MVTRRQWDDLNEAMDRLISLTDRVDRTTEQMQTVLMIREPNSTAAAEAYEGLRKQVVATATERRQHLVQLAEFEAAVRHGADGNQLLSMIDGWMQQAGLLRLAAIDDEDVAVAFDLTEDGGGPLEIMSPAYVDSRTNAVVRKGRARRSSPRPAPAPEDATSPSEGDTEVPQ